MAEVVKMGRNDSVNASGEIKECVIDFPEELETRLESEICIYTVPPAIREINKTSYTPQVISIGPIHYRKPELEAMELQKLRYLKEFCNRLTENEVKEKTVEEFLSYLWNKVIEEKRINIRRYYHADTSKICNSKFKNMILVDAIFILELFLKNHESSVNKNDFIMAKPWLRSSIRQDLILLENQLPYFFLEEIYNNCTEYFLKENIPHHNLGQGDVKMEFLNLTCDYFHCYKPKGALIPESIKISHFTDLVRYFWCFKYLLPSGQDKPQVTGERVKSHFWCFNYPLRSSDDTKPLVTGERFKSIGESESLITGERVKSLDCLTKLHDAGVKLKRIDGKCLTDIQFRQEKSKIPFFPCCICMDFLRRGELQIPYFEINDSTESVVRNVMAFELWHYPNDTYVCNYIKLMDLLIDTSKDVDLLVEKKIIVNELGDSKAIADMINKLCLQITEVRSCYHGLASELTKYYENPFNRAMANLKSVYFTNVWRGTGTIAAAVLLLLTFAQTICSILSLP